MKYIAIENSYGYQGAYWAKGSIVEADNLPNKHFCCAEPELQTKKTAKEGKSKKQ